MSKEKVEQQLTITIPQFNCPFALKTTIEHNGLKSASQIRHILYGAFANYLEKWQKKVEDIEITVSNGTESATAKLKDLDASVCGYIRGLLVKSVNAQFKNALLKQVSKDGRAVVWRPAWGTNAWSLLNQVAKNNRKPIVRLQSPDTVPDDAGFVYNTWNGEECARILIDKGYLIRVTNREWDTVRGRIMKEVYDNKQNAYIKQPVVDTVKGHWYTLTPLAKEFHEKNLDKSFRMINNLSGDPGIEKIPDEVFERYYDGRGY